MQITCWGTRGSLPSNGIQFTQYGGDTTCFEITSESGDLLIIDAGSGIRKLANKIPSYPQKTIHHLFTHYHLDHIMGEPFFHPIFNPAYTLNVFGPSVEGCDTVREAFEMTISPPYFPLGLEDNAIKANFNFQTIGETEFAIGSLTIKTIRLNHTNRGGLGYRIEENGKSVVILTDNELGIIHKSGHPRETFIEFSRDADLLFHDAQYTADEYKSHVGWGHSTPDEVVNLALKAGVQSCGFIHYDIDRTDEQIDEIYKPFDRYEECRFFPLKQGESFTL